MEDSEFITMPETGPYSKAFNEREFVAKALARSDGRRWDKLPLVSTLWLPDKLSYRRRAEDAIAAHNMWRLIREHDDLLSPSP
jgi:hypothetical protein